MIKSQKNSLISLLSAFLLSSCVSDGDCPSMQDSPEGFTQLTGQHHSRCLMMTGNN